MEMQRILQQQHVAERTTKKSMCQDPGIEPGRAACGDKRMDVRKREGNGTASAECSTLKESTLAFQAAS